MIRFAASKEIPTVLSPVMFSNQPFSTLRRALPVMRILNSLPFFPKNELVVKFQSCILSSVVLPNTYQEAALIREVFGLSKDKIRVVPNGVEKRFGEGDHRLFYERYGLKDFILFAGQADAPRKNILNLLKAMSEISTPLVIIGDMGKTEYGQTCRKIAEQMDHVFLIPTLAHDSDILCSAYHAADVFVLPSRFETPGIAAMEAALAGAKIVITEKGGTSDYFGERVEYINPDSIESIRKGIQLALKQKKDPVTLKNHILKHYTWEHTASLTAEIYTQVISKIKDQE
jgi:glycosyltransferase involved in cell wall biosynthesis